MAHHGKRGCSKSFRSNRIKRHEFHHHAVATIADVVLSVCQKRTTIVVTRQKLRSRLPANKENRQPKTLLLKIGSNFNGKIFMLHRPVKATRLIRMRIL